MKKDSNAEIKLLRKNGEKNKQEMKHALAEPERSKRGKLKSHSDEDKMERGTKVNRLKKHSNRNIV